MWGAELLRRTASPPIPQLGGVGGLSAQSRSSLLASAGAQEQASHAIQGGLPVRCRKALSAGVFSAFIGLESAAKLVRYCATNLPSAI